ncbi:nitroreductase/quinone reductase family protein [Actinotalea solisilvae]|uniref:nitroreductase/quinone reductase family protein n=1 Tax=Actinotalea solisilvae TaxID=2072922 RepID=UPI0018F1337E|nr:nitroreductase/quinone reductase family protein [Actinotalea solisilvae]
MTTTTRPAVEHLRPPRSPRAVGRVVCRVLASPRWGARLGRSLLVLHVVGRASGVPFSFPVAYRRTGDGRLLVQTSSRWRANLRGGADVEVTLLGRRRTARAEVVEDPDRVASAYRRMIQAVGVAQAPRRFGLRVRVDRMPTHDELADVVRRDDLALVYLDVR